MLDVGDDTFVCPAALPFPAACVCGAWCDGCSSVSLRVSGRVALLPAAWWPISRKSPVDSDSASVCCYRNEKNMSYKLQSCPFRSRTEASFDASPSARAWPGRTSLLLRFFFFTMKVVELAQSVVFRVSFPPPAFCSSAAGGAMRSTAPLPGASPPAADSGFFAVFLEMRQSDDRSKMSRKTGCRA